LGLTAKPDVTTGVALLRPAFAVMIDRCRRVVDVEGDATFLPGALAVAGGDGGELARAAIAAWWVSWRVVCSRVPLGVGLEVVGSDDQPQVGAVGVGWIAVQVRGMGWLDTGRSRAGFGYLPRDRHRTRGAVRGFVQRDGPDRGGKPGDVLVLHVLNTRGEGDIAPFVDRLNQLSGGTLKLAVQNKWERQITTADGDAIAALRRARRTSASSTTVSVRPGRC
jgi:hypothetical protein